MLLWLFPLSKKRDQGRNRPAPGTEFSYRGPNFSKCCGSRSGWEKQKKQGSRKCGLAGCVNTAVFAEEQADVGQGWLLSLGICCKPGRGEVGWCGYLRIWNWFNLTNLFLLLFLLNTPLFDSSPLLSSLFSSDDLWDTVHWHADSLVL